MCAALHIWMWWKSLSANRSAHRIRFDTCKSGGFVQISSCSESFPICILPHSFIRVRPAECHSQCTLLCRSSRILCAFCGGDANRPNVNLLPLESEWFGVHTRRLADSLAQVARSIDWLALSRDPIQFCYRVNGPQRTCLFIERHCHLTPHGYIRQFCRSFSPHFGPIKTCNRCKLFIYSHVLL